MVGIGNNMGHKYSKLIMGFVVQHTRSGQPSRSISPSFQRDISERKNKKDFPTLPLKR